jgi:hypothetical protein
MVKRTWLVLAALAAIAWVHPAMAQDDKGWFKLGEAHAGQRSEQDEIKLDKKGKDINWLKIEIENSAVVFKDAKVEYEDGSTQDLPILPLKGKNSAFGPYPLKMKKTPKKLILKYGTAPDLKLLKQAKIVVYGKS